MEPSENVRKFRWNQAKHEAAQLLAVDELTDDEIGQKVGADPRTLYRWRQHPEFAARVAEIVRALGEVSRRVAIANRNRRVRWLNDRVERMHSVIRERAAEPAMQEVPGGKTGLMVRTVRGVGAGIIVEEYEVDTALLKELREHEKQAAQEVGQWVDRGETVLKKLVAEVEGMTDEELRNFLGGHGDAVQGETGEGGGPQEGDAGPDASG